MRGFLLPAFLAGSLPVTAVTAQSVPAACQNGFASSIPCSERPLARWVRGFAFDAARDHWYVAVGQTLYQRPDPWTSHAVVQLQAPDEIGLAACPPGQGSIWCTALRGGTVFAFDPATSAL